MHGKYRIARVFTMAVGHSDDIDPAVAIATAIDQCREALNGQTPSAGLLFVGNESFETSIPAAVRTAFPGIQLVGSTSAAEMSSAAGYAEDSVTLAVFATDRGVDISVGVGNRADLDVEAASRAALTQALEATRSTPRLGVIFADFLAAQEALEVASRELPGDAVLVGGASSGPNAATVRPNVQFANDQIVENGVALLLFSGALNVSVAVGTGLHPVGPVATVTASRAGRIDEIDGRPASAFVAPYIGTAGPASLGNPLAVRQGATSGWYLRGMLGEDEKGALLISGAVPVGAQVQLTTANTEQILAATGDVVRRAMDGFPKDAQPSAALVFSCAVRKFMLGTRAAQEIVDARALLPKSLPVAGMYCFGEIAPVSGDRESRFHNETFVAVLLGD